MGVETLVGNCIIKCSLFFLSFFFFFKLVLQYLCSKVPNKALLFCVIRSLSKICVWKEIGKKSDIIIIIIIIIFSCIYLFITLFYLPFIQMYLLVTSHNHDLCFVLHRTKRQLCLVSWSCDYSRRLYNGIITIMFTIVIIMYCMDLFWISFPREYLFYLMKMFISLDLNQ